LIKSNKTFFLIIAGLAVVGAFIVLNGSVEVIIGSLLALVGLGEASRRNALKSKITAQEHEILSQQAKTETQDDISEAITDRNALNEIAEKIEEMPDEPKKDTVRKRFSIR
jgi:predicted Holliday junction resolvase-like endonuclease